jgi:hypothetical protein
MSLSDDTKIKIHIKKKRAPRDRQLNYRPSKEDLDTPEDLDIFSLLSVCRYHKIIVRGSAKNMCKVLKKKLYPEPYKTSSSEIVCKAYTAFFLWKLGNGDLYDNHNKPVNSDDFYSSVSAEDIPNVYVFYIKQDNINIHVFDIRSLRAYYLMDKQSFRNPYTDQRFDPAIIGQIKRKIKWLNKLGYPISYVGETLPTNNKLAQFTVDVFSHISKYQYVDHGWFEALTFTMLKKLYFELYEIWHYRLPMQEVYKAEMVKDGKIFTNWRVVERYKSSMHDVLRLETLENIERLATEGKTEDHCRAGCSMFMLGLVMVSEDAATSHPHLYQAAYMEDD